MENQQQRGRPCAGRKRRYRDWMLAPKPVPPPTTRARMQRGRAGCNEWNADLIPQNGNPGEINPPLPPVEDMAAVDMQLEAHDQDPGEQVHLDPPALERQCSDASSSLDNEASSIATADSVSQVSSESEDQGDNSEDESDEDDAGLARHPHLDDAHFPNGNCSKFECLLMMQSFAIRHGLTQVAIQDLCSLMNHTLRDEYLPTSKYMLKKIFGGSVFLLNFYCKRCGVFIVSKKHSSKIEGVFPCEICGEECKLSNMNDGHFFVTFSIKYQLKFLLQNTENIMELLAHRWNRNQDPDIISDIYDGKVYCNLTKEGNFLSNSINLSLTFNTHGAQVLESSKNTFWPIFFRINELPPSSRFNFNNCLLAGIWFARSEPHMHLFLSAFVQEVDDLYETGFSWISPAGETVSSKVILLNCVADSKARPLIQNCKTHNGYWGCGYCLHPGVMYEGSSQAKYPLNDDMAILRDLSFTYTVNAPDPTTKEMQRFVVEDREAETMRRTMELAEGNRNDVGNGDVKGVKGKSVLTSISSFDLVYGFPVEYMHAVLLGTARHVTMLWFNSSSHDQLYYVGRRIDAANRKLLNIKPPTTISRRPRKLCYRKKWHANEWRSWLLYYSLPCMDGILPTRYLKHHCLLVSAIYILLTDKISRDDLESATYYIGAYLREFSNLYSSQLVYFNVHLLLHLGKCVDMWGPLFCYSSFSFEGANCKLLNLVKGTKGVLSQIAEKYTKCRIMPKIVDLYNVQEVTLKYCEDLMSYRTSKIAYKYDAVTVLGPPKSFPLDNEETAAFEKADFNVTSSSYERMVMCGVMFHARCYMRKGEQSDCSIVQLQSGDFGAIERIIEQSEIGPLGKVHVLLREINILRGQSVVAHPAGAKAEHIQMCTPDIFGGLRLIPCDSIKQLGILIDVHEKSFVTTFPNIFEKD